IATVHQVDRRQGSRQLGAQPRLKTRGLGCEGCGPRAAYYRGGGAARHLWDAESANSEEISPIPIFQYLRLYSVVMSEPRRHHYRILNRWTGNLGSGTSNYRAYSRNHELSGEGKQAPVVGSSDPAFRGDPSRYNPEELLVGALSACHMLWVLHRCADAGIVVTEYVDESEGEMVEHA